MGATNAYSGHGLEYAGTFYSSSLSSPLKISITENCVNLVKKIMCNKLKTCQNEKMRAYPYSCSGTVQVILNF